jgi:hypothetical protein
MPSSGILEDQHPFAAGVGGLTNCQNVYLKDGRFQSRDGLVPMDPILTWYDRLLPENNIVPDDTAAGNEVPSTAWNTTSGFVVIASEEDPLAADAAYRIFEAGGPVGEDKAGAYLEFITVTEGLNYAAGILVKGPVASVTMEFVDGADEALQSTELTGEASDDFVLFYGQAVAPATAEKVTIFVELDYATFEDNIHMAAIKIVEDASHDVLAWSRGDGCLLSPEENLLPFSVVHPYSDAEVSEVWDALLDVENLIAYNGTPVNGLFTTCGYPLIYGRSVAFIAWATEPSTPDYGMETGEDYRAPAAGETDYKISVVRTYSRAGNVAHPILFMVSAVFYDDGGAELDTEVINSMTIALEDDFTSHRARIQTEFTTPTDTAAIGIRITATASGAADAIFGVMVDDIKIVESSGASTIWFDFCPETPTYGGPTGEGEYPLAYLLYDYLFEGATTQDRIVMGTDGSIWLWDETEKEFQQIGFDLATVYSPFYQTNLEDTTLESRITFVETDDEGYTQGPGEDEQLSIEIEMPKADEGSTSPYPCGWWRYRVNGGDWSDKYSLWDDDEETDPVLTAEIEYNSRTLPIEITLSTDNFLDVCQNTEDNEITENPIFEGTISTRKHDGQAGETCLHADRDNPVTFRGYDYAQKTNLIICDANDRVEVWDGQATSKVGRSGSNAPFAKTIAISGGRVLAGNVRFEDPYDELILPLGVVYTDTYLSKGYGLWHPELAIRLADTPGEIVNLTELGSMMTVGYKTDAIHVLVLQTGQDPFRQQRVATNIPGPISVRSVAQVAENVHTFLGEDGGLYMFDGTRPTNFSPTIQATIESELDLSYKERAFLVYTPRLNAVLAMYPTKGSEGVVNRGMYVDMAAQAGWPFEWPGTVFDFTAAAPVQRIKSWEAGGITVRMGDIEGELDSGQALQPDFFMGDARGYTLFQDSSATDDYYEPIYTIIRSGLSEFGNLDKFSIMREIEFIINRTNSAQELEARIWASDYGLEATPVSRETFDLSAEGPYSTRVREKSRYWGYELRGLLTARLVFSGAYGSMRPVGYRKS